MYRQSHAHRSSKCSMPFRVCSFIVDIHAYFVFCFSYPPSGRWHNKAPDSVSRIYSDVYNPNEKMEENEKYTPEMDIRLANGKRTLFFFFRCTQFFCQGFANRAIRFFRIGWLWMWRAFIIFSVRNICMNC